MKRMKTKGPKNWRWRTSEIVKQQTNEKPSNKKQTQNDTMFEAGERISKPSFLASMLNFGGVTQTFVILGKSYIDLFRGWKRPWWRNILETKSYPTWQVEKSEGNAKLHVLLIFLFHYSTMQSSMSAELIKTHFSKSTWVLYHWTSGLPIFHLRIHDTFGCEISKCKKTPFPLWLDCLFGSSFPSLAQQSALLIPYFPTK